MEEMIVAIVVDGSDSTICHNVGKWFLISRSCGLV